MSGRGDQPRNRVDNPLGGLKEEVLSALKLLFKHVAQHPVDLDMSGHMTAYLTDIPTAVHAVPLETPTIRVSEDPIQSLRHEVQARTLPLLPEVRLADAAPCAFEPVASHEPVFSSMQFETTGISFENMAARKSKSLPVENLQAQSFRKKTEKPAPPGVEQISVGKFQTKDFSILEHVPKIRTMNTPRFYGLPIKKSPIPPHRFPADLRERFRQMLAEKAGTRTNNVQLKIVFEPMDMNLYASIQQDDHGNLLCTPRNELLGKNRTQNKGISAEGGSAYLVYGSRLDTREDIRVLVPAGSVRNESPKTESP
jgi:hypothetical protein